MTLAYSGDHTAGAGWRTLRAAKGRAIVFACALLTGLAGVLSLTLGPVALSAGDLWAIFLAQFGVDSGADPTKMAIVESIRAPRTLLGLAAGAALGAAGAAMQGFFRNPLADPALIGVSSGAALAAVSVIVLGGSALLPLTAFAGPAALPLAAFLGALVAVGLIYQIAKLDGRVIVATMLLAGVALNALIAAGIGFLTFLADDAQLRTLTFWTLGSLGGASWQSVTPAIVLCVIAALALQRLAGSMNCLLLGESDARHLGVNVERTKALAAVFTALGVGAATAVCGIIGFIGLVTPHLVRLATGPDHKYVLPGSALLGAAILVFADLGARLMVAPAELPLGVVTAFLGAPFFFWLLLRDKNRGGSGGLG